MSDAYTTATVKSNAEFDKKLSPLSLELADRITALPKFRIRETIAAIINPYLVKK